jgi:hypothetical protein
VVRILDVQESFGLPKYQKRTRHDCRDLAPTSGMSQRLAEVLVENRSAVLVPETERREVTLCPDYGIVDGDGS